MKATILTFIERPEATPVVEEKEEKSVTVAAIADPAEEKDASTTAMEASRPQLTRDSVFRNASVSGVSLFGDEDIDYKNEGPSYTGNRTFKCFKNRGNGLLFRIVNDDEHKWAFYNDLNDYTMIVTCTVGATSEVKPLGQTTKTVNATTGETVLQVTVGPVETQMFLDGVPKGFKLSYEAQPIPRAECLARHLIISDANRISATEDAESLPRNSVPNGR